MSHRIPKYRVQLVREGTVSYPINRFVECSADVVSALEGMAEYQEGIEVFSVIYLDTKHRILWVNALSKGTINSASVYPREIVKQALLVNAAAVVLVHNHPSGNPEPSAEDRRVTEQTKQACTLLDISVLDHVILGEGQHFSFADKRMM